MSCHSVQEICDDTGEKERSTQRIIENLRQNGHLSDLSLFRNFEPQVYTQWNFAKATNEVRHFGNIPPEIIDNLLWFYTKPFDVVFDPFAGGGTTVVCFPVLLVVTGLLFPEKAL